VYDATIKLLPSKSNDVCLAIFQGIHNDSLGTGKCNAIDRQTLGNRFYNTISTSAGVSTGRKSDQRGRKSDKQGRKSDQCWSNFRPARSNKFDLKSGPTPSKPHRSEIYWRPISILSKLVQSQSVEKSIQTFLFSNKTCLISNDFL
jgi:hypothetical protein